MDYINKFGAYLTDKGKAKKTVESYTGDLRGYFGFLTDRDIAFDGILNRFTIISYKNHLIEYHYEPTTINKKLNSIQSFNDFLIESNLMTESVINLARDRIKIAKGSEKPVEVYSSAVVEALQFHLETKVKNLRDKVLVELLFYTGVRVSELVSIRIRDIDFLSHHVKVVGKGGKYREVPLKPELVDTIKKYIVERRHNPYYKSEYLLLGQRGALGRDAINRILARITKEAKLPQKLKPHAFSSYEREALEALKRVLFCPENFNEHRHLINLKNGMYDINQHMLIAHDIAYYSSVQLPYAYDPDATCPRFIQFLYEVFDGDEELIAKAVEWLGYCMTIETKAQKSLILFGGGSNGKGVFTEVMTALVGKVNISNIPLTDLGSDFNRVHLFNKTVNMAGENEVGKSGFNSQHFKTIIGEDIITASYKGIDGFSFKPFCKLVLTFNNLPFTMDKSDGYFRRLDFLPFTRFLSEEEKDPYLREKLMEEIPGIFNLAMEGLERLQNNSYRFTKCKASEELLRDYKAELSPMMQYFDEKIFASDDDYRNDNKAVYDSYITWVRENGYKAHANITKKTFWRQFKEESNKRKINVSDGHSGSSRYHTGFRIVKEFE